MARGWRELRSCARLSGTTELFSDSNFKQQIHACYLAARLCPSFAFRCPSRKEGAGNAGCALHPRSRVQNGQRKTHTSIQVQRRHSGIPCAMALRLITRSPRRIGLCCLRRLRIAGSSAPGRADLPSADLTPTPEASGPHDFTVRCGIARQHALRSLTSPKSPPCDPIARTTPPRPPHPIPTFVTMANAPSPGTGCRES